MGIKLSPIDEVDIDLIKKWQNDVNIKYPIMGFRFPIQKKSVEDWLDGLRAGNGLNRVVYGIKINTTAVGMVSLHDIDYINRHAMFGIYVAEKKQKDNGIGTRATTLILDFAFNAMGLNRVALEVLKSNKHAIHIYKKIGFVKEGIKRRAFYTDGNFVDVEIMSILRSEFFIDKMNTEHRLVYSSD